MLAAVIRISATRLSVDPQTVLDAVAPFRTGFVETKDGIDRYQDLLPDASEVDAMIAAIDPGCFAEKINA